MGTLREKMPMIVTGTPCSTDAKVTTASPAIFGIQS